MANSFVRYTGNNSTTAYSIPFSYRATGDLSVTLGGVANTAFTLNAAGTTLTFNTAPANAVAIEIRRRTSQTTKLVDYASGSVLTENDLDTDSDQAFFMSQEAIDDAGDVIKVSNTDFQWDAQNKRLTNVANPTSDQDVATKHYLENTWLSASDKTAIANLGSSISQINLLGTSDAVADMNTLATSDVISDMNTLANSDIVSDLNTLASSDIVSDMNTLATSANVTAMGLLGTSSNVTAMGLLGTSGVIADLNTLATSAIVTDMDILATSANVTAMGHLGTSANVTAMGLLGTSSNVTNMATVASKNTEIGLLGTSANATAIGLLGTSAVIADMNTLATSDIISDLNTLASSGIVEDLNILATSANVTAMGLLGTSAVVTDLGLLGTSANVTNMATLGTSTNVSNMSTLAGITNLSNLASAHAAVSNVSTNLAGVNSFAERYRVQAGVPSSSLNVGDLNFDTTANELKVYKSSGWASAGSTINGTSARFTYTATANQTTFTGADNNGSTLAYDASFIDCYLNGVKLINGTDVTVTSGTSVVLATGATVGDTLDLVGFGTFNVASITGASIVSGTINNDRLPAPVLSVKGDGSSADGALRLNCSQNSHYTEIKSAPHGSYAGNISFTLPTSTGTNGQVLSTNGLGALSFIDATETKPTVADVSQTIAPATATTINITGTNFVAIPIVEFINPTTGVHTVANTVSLTNATTLSVNVTLATGNYYVRIENPDGNAGRSTNNILTASTAPTFSTNAGSLGSIAGNFSGTVATIAGSSDSAVTFSEVGSNLSGANVTLASNGVLSTTDFGGSSTTATLYNFTIRITDAEGQTADRAFSLQSSFGATGGGQFN